MVRRRKILYITLMVMAIFVLTGCERLKRWDERLGEIFFSEERATTTVPFWEDLGTLISENIASSSIISKEIDIKKFVAELTKEQKIKIDNWLEVEGLNRYGDPSDTYYTGGTPLFDEATGETKERYEYILENHKELLNILN